MISFYTHYNDLAELSNPPCSLYQNIATTAKKEKKVNDRDNIETNREGKEVVGYPSRTSDGE